MGAPFSSTTKRTMAEAQNMSGPVAAVFGVASSGIVLLMVPSPLSHPSFPKSHLTVKIIRIFRQMQICFRGPSVAIFFGGSTRGRARKNLAPAPCVAARVGKRPFKRQSVDNVGLPCEFFRRCTAWAL